MAKKHFAKIDLMEGYSIMGLVKIDFDNSYPHTNIILEEWVKKWKHEVREPLIAFKENDKISVVFNGNKNVYLIDTDKLVLLEALVLAINLARPIDLVSVERMLENVFPAIQIFKERPCLN